MKVRTCKELKSYLSQRVCSADNKVIYLHYASCSFIWFHFSATIITLDWIREHNIQWVPYEKVPLN